jgi:hypothetical protein
MGVHSGPQGGVVRFRASAGVLALGLAVIVGGCTSDSEDGSGGVTPLDLPVAESFEGGSEGDDVTTGNSIFNVVVNETATFATSPTPIDGSFVGRYATGGQYIRTKVEFTDSKGASRAFERVYLWIEQYPSDVMRFLTLETSPNVSPPGEDVLALRMDEAGYVTLHDGTRFDEAHRSVAPLPLHEWIRLEVALDETEGPHGRSVLHVFTGAELEGSQPTETVTVDHVDSPANPVTTAAFGVLNRVTVDFSIDAIEVATDDWIGPVETEPSSADG